MMNPFPRTLDDAGDAWSPGPVRFTPAYEARAEALWDAAVETGFQPGLALAGSEDGEVLYLATPGDDAWLCLIALEDPSAQDEIDAVRAQGREALTAWVRQQAEQG